MKYNKFSFYFLLCIIIFFILSFVVLFYSFGYKYNPLQGKIIQTGAIILKTYPKNVQISINGVTIKKNSGLAGLFDDFIKIDSLVPREYNLKASLEGFSSWEKNIAVESEHVIEFKNIVLIKKEPEKNLLSEKIEVQEGESNFWISNGKNKLVYRKPNAAKEALFIFDLGQKKETVLYNFEDIFPIKNSANIAIKNVVWSDNDSKLLVSATKDKKDYSVVIVLDDSKRIYRLTDNFANLKNKWDFEFSDSLFYVKNGILMKSGFFDARITTIKLLENVSGFLADGNTIYFMRPEDKNFYKADISNPASQNAMFELPESFDASIRSRITKSWNNYLILTSDNSLYLKSDELGAQKISSNANEAKFFNNSARIIYSNNNEIWLYYMKNIITQPKKQEHANEIFTRYSGNLSDIYLYSDEEHIFYKEGFVFKFSELDERGGRNVFDVISAKTDDVVYLSGNDSILYLENGNLIQSFLDDEKR